MMNAGGARAWMGVVAVVAMGVGGGCKDNFDPAWLVQHARVMGARVEVQSDATDRASPAPGETATVTWQMAYPDAAPPLTWAFAWCPEAPILFGTPRCAGNAAPTFATPQQTPVSGTTPSLSFTVPDAEQLQGATSMLVLGVICVDGTVSVDPSLLTDPSALNDVCQGAGARPLLVEDSVPLAVGGVSNHNPELYALSFDGYGQWLEPSASVFDASADGCPPDQNVFAVHAADQTAKQITIQISPDSRETYQGTGTDGEATTLTEQTVVAHASTAGTMDSLFSFIDQPGQILAGTYWTPPKPADLEYNPQLVRFYFVISDQRGGEQFATRAVCVHDP